jgi:tRNA-modifying protein YgfZ
VDRLPRYLQSVTMDVAEAIEIDGQYRLLREDAGLVAASPRGVLEVSGTEAAEFLQGQLTNDVEALVPPADSSAGSGCYAALLDRKGHMQADMRVLRLAPDRFSIDTEPSTVETVRRHLDTYKIGRDVGLADVSAERSILSVIGPEAADRVAAALELAPTAIPREPEGAHRELSSGRLGFQAIATGGGIDLVAEGTAAEALRERLLGAGIGEVGADAAEIVRVEAGRPRFGLEMSAQTIPQEAGINERAVSFTKGCYIGQETVARLHYKGKPNRHLRGLALERPVANGDPVSLDGRELGHIGTAVHSPARGPIALAILRREAEPGARVSVGDGVPAEVVELPFA